MAWSRSVLLQAAFLGSAVNVVVPLAVAELTVLENVAIWLGTRAAIQLLVALVPSPIHALLQSQGGGFDSEQVREISGATPAYLGSISVLVFCAALTVLSLFYPAGGQFIGFNFALALFASILFLSFSSFAILRFRQRGDLMLTISVRDLFLTLLCIPVLSFGFTEFILAASAKEIVKIAHVLPHFGTPLLRVPPFGAMLRGGSQYFRGLAQVASQYLERTAFPFVFGLKVAGQLGLGSTLGVLPVMLSSNMYLWSFPRIAEGGQVARRALIAEWSRLQLLAASLCWWVAAVASFVDIGPYGSVEVAVAATFTATMGVGFLATARSREALLSTSSSWLHLAVLAGVYGAIAMASAAGSNVPIALAAGIGVSTSYTLWVASRLESGCARMLMSHSLVGLFGVAGFVVYVQEAADWNNGGCGIVAAALTAPYLSAFLRRRFHE